MAEVILQNITKVFPGGIVAVRDLSLHIQDGEFLVLVGPSGCGKSTTLRAIAGLEEVTGGTISIGDRVVNKVSPKDRDVAMVFQNYALYPHMTVYKNMAFALKLRKLPRKEIDRRVRDTAAILGIEDLLERKPKALSGGQRQRVAVGRAIVRQPKAFLFDEPLSNLDAKLRVEMRAELKRLHRRLGTTTIYVTHDQEEAMTLGDHIVVMKDGLVQQVGAPLEVYNMPANRFVASFVGTPPMNFFDGQLAGEGREVFFDEGSARIRLPWEKAGTLAPWIGKQVVMGVRPEAMSLHGEGRFGGGDNALPVKISVIEPLGEKMDIFAETPRHDRIVARVEAQGGIVPGEQRNVYLDIQRIHLFDPGEGGVNLTLGSKAPPPGGP